MLGGCGAFFRRVSGSRRQDRPLSEILDRAEPTGAAEPLFEVFSPAVPSSNAENEISSSENATDTSNSENGRVDTDNTPLQVSDNSETVEENTEAHEVSSDLTSQPAQPPQQMEVDRPLSEILDRAEPTGAAEPLCEVFSPAVPSSNAENEISSSENATDTSNSENGRVDTDNTPLQPPQQMEVVQLGRGQRQKKIPPKLHDYILSTVRMDPDPTSEIEAKVCREFPETENPSRRALSLNLSCTDSLSSLSPPRRRSLSLSSPAPCGGGGDRISTFSYPCFQIKIYAKLGERREAHYNRSQAGRGGDKGKGIVRESQGAYRQEGSFHPYKGKHPRGYGDGASYQGRYTGYGDRRIGATSYKAVVANDTKQLGERREAHYNRSQAGRGGDKDKGIVRESQGAYRQEGSFHPYKGKHPRGYGDGPSYQGRYTGYGDRRIGVRRSPVVGTVNKVGSDGTGASSSKVRKTLLFEEPAPTIQIVTTDQDVVAVEDTPAMQEIPVVQKQGEVEEETKLAEERSLY
ncbi:hypothetical protein F2Q68_00034603 [Brassica cretica]|uniref:Uncharacterized protein n=1 Tax=Brassica cretica TaxID=69181 RepID=A0A8S9H3Q0_BRACR|nr:hypothetical protein F2Q68_00034603 [Brassica cretica]